MAANPAILNIDFTSEYTAGCFRIASRIQGSGDPYVITQFNCTPFVPPTTNVPCTAQVAITVDDETCEDVTYEGYIQPCCEDEASLVGRVPFSVTFTPDPLCSTYSVECVSVGIESVTVDTPGDGYAPGTMPALLFTPAGDAVGYAKVEDDGVEAFTLTNPGSGGGPAGIYLNQQAVAIVSGATSHAYFDYTITAGAVTAISVTPLIENPDSTGVGYTVGDTITLPGAWGVNPIITIDDIYDNGEILVTVITNPGEAYTGVPTVAVDAVGGTAPGLTAVLANCENAFGNLCDGTPAGSIVPIPLGFTINTCRQNTPIFPQPVQLNITEIGCCADAPCVELVVVPNMAFAGTVYFTDCITKEATTNKGALVPLADNDLGCVVQGSVFVYPPSEAANITITQTDPCV